MCEARQGCVLRQSWRVQGVRYRVEATTWHLRSRAWDFGLRNQGIWVLGCWCPMPDPIIYNARTLGKGRTTANMLRTFTRKPTPKSGLDCLACAEFARVQGSGFRVQGSGCTPGSQGTASRQDGRPSADAPCLTPSSAPRGTPASASGTCGTVLDLRTTPLQN